jgi:hypothetical protein
MRLIAFGCSLTYGHGLPDCFVPPYGPGLNPSKLAWPELVAKTLHKECINTSAPGASNKKIWNIVLNFEFKDNDLIFIHWSFPARTAMIREDGVVDISHNNKHDLYYQNFYDDYDSEVMSKLFVSHTNFYLNSKNLKVYNLVANRKLQSILTLKEMTTSHLPVYIQDSIKKFPYALDGSHPGIECHEFFSNQILQELDK